MRHIRTAGGGLVRRLVTARAEAGQGLAETAVILALVAIVCIGALTTLGTAIADSPGWGIP